MLITTRPAAALSRASVALSVAAAAVAAGLLIGRQPMLLVALVALAGVLWFLLPRPTLVISLLAGCFFYDDFFTENFGFWNPGKLLGLVAVASVGLSWLIERRPIVWAPQIVALVGLSASLAISYTFARDPYVARQVMVRYVMFFALFCITLQAVRTRAHFERIVDITIIAATFAALIGLNNFFFYGAPRVAGPLANAGDFGFLLGATVPLALYRAATSRGPRQVAAIAATVVLVAAIIGTFARADALGMAVAGVWVLVTGRLRLRWAAIAIGAVVLIALTAYEVRPDLVESSLRQKRHIAQQNIDSRWGLWGVAIDEWESAPVFGVGPGNYEVRFPEFKSPFRQRVETTHNAYLNVISELGVVGLAFFLLFIAQSWLQLRRRRAGVRDDLLQTALAAGFLVAFVGAQFMTQQFYPPLWFLSALGTVMTSVIRDDDAVPA